MTDKSDDGQITIKDIARKLGMSHTTVSRALNDHTHTSASTKALVRRAASELGYIPHSAARAMRRGHGRLVGLVVPVVTTEFYQTITKVLAERAKNAGYQLVLALTEDDPASEQAQVQTLLEARAAGIIIAPTAAPSARTLEMLRATTCLQLNRFLPRLGCDALGFDDAGGMRSATEHLIALGHRRIGFIGATTEMSTGSGRLDGYHDALRRSGISSSKELLRLGRPRISFGFESAIELISEAMPPTALIFSSSEITTGGLEAIRNLDLAVPGDLSIVGYTDPPWYRLIQPALTTVRLPVAALAETTASLLFSRIERGKTDPDAMVQAPTRMPILPELIVRGSTAPPRTHRA